MYPILKLAIKEQVKWIEHDEGIWISEFYYWGKDWDTNRRVVVVKQHVETVEKPLISGYLKMKKFIETTVIMPL